MLINNPHVDFPSLLPLWEGWQGKPKAGFKFNVQILPLPPWQRSFTLILSLTVVEMAGSQLEVCLQVALTLGGFVFLMCYTFQLHRHHLNLLCRLVHFLSFSVSGEAMLSIGLCLICLKATIFSLGAILCYSRISDRLTSSHYPEGGGWAVNHRCHQWCWLLLQYFCCS